MLAETLRYGAPSTLEESIYDRPFQWGSKRTGPDVARLGGKYPDLWHLKHMKDPRSTSAGSIMPNYAWLEEAKIRYDQLPKKIRVMQALGVPYPDGYDEKSIELAKAQAKEVAENLKLEGGFTTDYSQNEIVALIAYLQRLGKMDSDQPMLKKEE